jgi:hypothetical protein
LPDVSGHAEPHGIDKLVRETDELTVKDSRVACMLCSHQFALPLTDGHVLKQVLAHLGGDDHESLRQARNHSINTYFQPAAPPPPRIVPDPRQLCWGLHAYELKLASASMTRDASSPRGVRSCALSVGAPGGNSAFV